MHHLLAARSSHKLREQHSAAGVELRRLRSAAFLHVPEGVDEDCPSGVLLPWLEGPTSPPPRSVWRGLERGGTSSYYTSFSTSVGNFPGVTPDGGQVYMPFALFLGVGAAIGCLALAGRQAPENASMDPEAPPPCPRGEHGPPITPPDEVPGGLGATSIGSVCKGSSSSDYRPLVLAGSGRGDQCEECGTVLENVAVFLEDAMLCGSCGAHRRLSAEEAEEEDQEKAVQGPHGGVMAELTAEGLVQQPETLAQQPERLVEEETSKSEAAAIKATATGESAALATSEAGAIVATFAPGSAAAIAEASRASGVMLAPMPCSAERTVAEVEARGPGEED
mmetsp:Transcript_1600/g.3638  ORF Transcript_1600/g.3638 Transcript_1600/m.3638 type:complete len:336 (-) Transcript_1600:103-1110(-)